MPQGSIVVRGARQHNLKNISLEIPREKLVVITGVSGSGKSTLAFDTIFAEGQRRYVESLSSYARQFLGQMDKPDVDSIEGLSPAISIDQKTTTRNPRSTVGTVTEIYDYLRVLFARIGKPYCPECGKEIAPQTIDQMVDRVLELREGTRIQILAPVVRGRKGEHERVLEDLRRSGYVRVRVDGETRSLDETIRLEKNKKHSIEAVVDRIVVKPGVDSRLADSLGIAAELGDGLVIVDVLGEREMVFSERFACVDCGVSIPEIAPRMFSFNSPYGACPECHGLGSRMEIDVELVIPDKRKTLNDGAIVPWSKSLDGCYHQLLEAVARHYGFSMDIPVQELPPEALQVVLYGSKGEYMRFRYENQYGRVRTKTMEFEGVIPNLERRYRESPSDSVREEGEEYMNTIPCPVCRGTRLRKESLSVKVGGLSIAEVTALTARQAIEFFKGLRLGSRDELIASRLLREIVGRLGFMVDVGLDYLTLDRAASTLSGGEAQRIRLATQIGSGLTGVIYILDEPSVGLHQRDNRKLIETLKRLRDLGNTVIVVEHDENTILSADHVIDIGPGAGRHGGEVVASGSVEDIIRCRESVTGDYLSGRCSIQVPPRRRPVAEKFLMIRGAKEHNLKDIDVRIPLGLFVCITGVSGSGKSTLVTEILYKGLAARLHGARFRPGEHDGIEGVENIEKVINIDQSPIGRTPRSNPATYTGVFDFIREVFSKTPEARVRGYKPGRFSFNVRGGRCEACHGDGTLRIEMHFLPDVYVTCDVCKGKRYNRETLEVRYKGKNITDVLDMTVDEALEFFAPIPKIRRKLETLSDVGLGYIRLGQPATTLSGGEAQRVKLATELSRRSNGRTLYILDEPTTGLHMADVHRLLNVLQQLVDSGNTAVVIEHNPDVIKSADYVIDLGPEGGDGGGWVVTEGTPEEVAEVPYSYTGHFLREILAEHRGRVLVSPGA